MSSCRPHLNLFALTELARQWGVETWDSTCKRSLKTSTQRLAPDGLYCRFRWLWSRFLDFLRRIGVAVKRSCKDPQNLVNEHHHTYYRDCCDDRKSTAESQYCKGTVGNNVVPREAQGRRSSHRDEPPDGQSGTLTCE
jgi:hypothetical protein